MHMCGLKTPAETELTAEPIWTPVSQEQGQHFSSFTGLTRIKAGMRTDIQPRQADVCTKVGQGIVEMRSIDHTTRRARSRRFANPCSGRAQDGVETSG